MDKNSKSEWEKERLRRLWPSLSEFDKFAVYLKVLWFSTRRRLTTRLFVSLVGQFFILVAALRMEPYDGFVFWLIASLVVVGWFMSPSLSKKLLRSRYHWVEADEQTVRRH